MFRSPRLLLRYGPPGPRGDLEELRRGAEEGSETVESGLPPGGDRRADDFPPDLGSIGERRARIQQTGLGVSLL